MPLWVHAPPHRRLKVVPLHQLATPPVAHPENPRPQLPTAQPPEVPPAAALAQVEAPAPDPAVAARPPPAEPEEANHQPLGSGHGPCHPQYAQVDPHAPEAEP